MVKQYKLDEVNLLIEKLEAKKNIIFTDYSGVSVKELGSLRRQLREKNAEYKVVKNNFLKRALKEAGYENLDSYLKGPLGIAFVADEVGEVAKVLKNFEKEEKNFSFSIGVIDNILYQEEQVRRIADLPPKDVILSQIMSLVNGPTTGIAVGVNEIMASLARGIKAVAEANS